MTSEVLQAPHACSPRSFPLLKNQTSVDSAVCASRRGSRCSTTSVQVHKGKLRAVPQESLPLDIRIAAKRQRRTYSSWQLGLGPEVLYTPSLRASHPSKVLPGAV